MKNNKNIIKNKSRGTEEMVPVSDLNKKHSMNFINVLPLKISRDSALQESISQ